MLSFIVLFVCACVYACMYARMFVLKCVEIRVDQDCDSRELNIISSSYNMLIIVVFKFSKHSPLVNLSYSLSSKFEISN